MPVMYGALNTGGDLGEDTTGYKGVISQEKCTMFVKRFCPYSIEARKLLHKRGISCKVIEVDYSPEAHDFAKRYQRTFPVFFLNDTLIKGGYEKLKYLSDRNLPPFDNSPLPIDRRSYIG
ncbi:glutaredoxin-like protein [Encephalitozoon romaleae SJ-2008]|uniref:Glutaredoxin-like protein n=1 Tax=Encephalitozoon romaleae (strain SJ-2008) TaxID=1178016 RepID=I7AP24_ENCRO|nr:glutaredoxin-like protein [Encephalitozoon romaleae SJ-2008]AFN83554.1 glutaredoxin-like protein [Encephalitozoon romaleae SJ-2008]